MFYYFLLLSNSFFYKSQITFIIMFLFFYGCFFIPFFNYLLYYLESYLNLPNLYFMSLFLFEETN